MNNDIVTNPGLVINLSDLPLTDDQVHILNLGPKFVPTPHTLNHQEFEQDVNEGCRLVRLKELLYDEKNHTDSTTPKFYKKNFFMPSRHRDKHLDNYCDELLHQTKSWIVNKNHGDNLHKNHRKAIRDLRQHVLERSIRISPADKGGAVVVQNVTDYIQEGLRQLQNADYYRVLSSDPTYAIAKKMNDLTVAISVIIPKTGP